MSRIEEDDVQRPDGEGGWDPEERDLERALASLPEPHRIVVILSDLEEFSYAEIAQALEVPVGTVRSRLARARGALQKLLWQQADERGLKAAAAPITQEGGRV